MTKRNLSKVDLNKDQHPAKRPNFLSLESSLNDKDLQVHNDNKFICIKDKYPKSKCHYLLVPIEKKFKGLNEFHKADLELLENLRDLSDMLIKTKFATNDVDKYMIGFHSIQSMYPLHMHIITNDFQSDYLKNKKHWNSFNTKYFVRLNNVIEHLRLHDDLSGLVENHDKLERYLKMDLMCNKCTEHLANIPKLKQHLLKHK
jgi:aprataxin